MQHLGRIGAGLVALGFFLPWINLMGIIKISGLFLTKAIFGAASEGFGIPGYAYGIPLILILAIAALITNKKSVLRIAGIFPFLYIGVALASAGGMPPMEIVGIGMWLTLAGGIAAIVGSGHVEEGGSYEAAPEAVDIGGGDS